mgnify:CR=1 FL=1
MSFHDLIVNVERFIYDYKDIDSKMTLGKMIESNAGVAFETTNDIMTMRSKLFKEGVYRLVVVNSEGNELFFKCQLI